MFTAVFVLLCPEQKAACTVPVKDGVLQYEFESQGSCAGSLGCCSLLESDNDLQFLNDLGPKFKTLAEVCSLPEPSQTSTIEGVVTTTADIVETLVKSKSERIVETTIETEKVKPSSSITISKSTVSTAPPPVERLHSQTNIGRSASLSGPVQSVVLNQPIYYATSPVPQPVHYIVQPQLQNTVLLSDGVHNPNFPGLYVVSGSQTPSGLVISGSHGSPSAIVIQGIESSKTTSQLSSPTTSPVSPTVVLPGSPGVSHGPIPVDRWNIIGQNPDGNYIVIQKKNSAVVMDPGSSQGTLPRGAVLVKKAAPPQGVLGPAAYGSVYSVVDVGWVNRVHLWLKVLRMTQILFFYKLYCLSFYNDNKHIPQIVMKSEQMNCNYFQIPSVA